MSLANGRALVCRIQQQRGGGTQPSAFHYGPGSGLHRPVAGQPDQRARPVQLYEQRSAALETIKYRVFDAGVMESTEYGLPNAEGWGSHSVQFTDGKVLVAWSTRDQTAISYVIINDVKNPGTPSKQNLSAPNNRPVGNVSLFADKSNRCILVWIDYRYLNFIYYAVVLSNGTVLTPAMTYQGEGNNLSLYTSENGLAITTYDGAFRVQVPVVRK